MRHMYRYICTYKACASNQYGANSGWGDNYVDARCYGRTIEDRRAMFERIHQRYFHTHAHLHTIKRIKVKTK